MNLWTEIRQRVLTGQLSKRAACRQYGIHWATLEKILCHEEPPGYRLGQARAKAKLAAVLPIIHQILMDDRTAPRKQRHTAQRIFQRLRNEHGYTGGKTQVQEAVRLWHATSAEVFVPLSQRAGCAQFDFGEATIVLADRETKIAFFVMSLPYSDAFYCQVFPRECTETFQEAHVRAFRFFGGVPRQIRYDNTRVAVARIVGRRGDTATKALLRLESHFLFEHHFCLVRRPQEKGHTENLIGYARRNFLVPLPRVDSLEQLNDELTRQCQADLERRVRGEPLTKSARLQEERQELRAIPHKAFEPRRVEVTRASSLSLVRFDRNDYSIPTASAHHTVTAVGTIEEVRFIVDSRVVARHVRDWAQENTHYNPVHYLAVLERKPGAFDHARPLEEWHLPEGYEVLRRRLESHLGKRGRREYIRILRLLEHHQLADLTAAVEQALAIGATTHDAIKVLVTRREERPAQWFCLDGHPHLQGHEIPPPKLSAYGELLTEGGGR